MARRKLFEAQKWQIVGMKNAGLSTRNIAGQFRVNQSIIVRLLQRYPADGTLSERQRSGRPRKVDERDNRFLVLLARANPTITGRKLRNVWPVYGPISVRTVTWTLHKGGIKAKRSVKRPLLTPRHKELDLTGLVITATDRMFSPGDVCIGPTNVNFFYVTLTTESVFGVKITQRTMYLDRNIVGTTAFDRGTVTVWACFSYGC